MPATPMSPSLVPTSAATQAPSRATTQAPRSRSRRKPVQSAEAVAALRAASCREPVPALRNPDTLARHFVTSALYRGLLGLPAWLSRRLIERITPGSYSYFLARTQFIDSQLRSALSDGVEQIVILGAGYDTRAIRFARELGSLPVFEIDLESTQRAKRHLLAKQGIKPGASIHFVAHDFTQGDLLDSLVREGFHPHGKTFFIWEGVTYYLPEANVLDVLDRLMSQAAPGSRMAFDYSIRSFVEGRAETYGGAEMHAWLRKNHEPFLFGMEPDQLPVLVGELGLSVREDLGPLEFSKAYLVSPEGDVVGQPLGHLRMAVIEKTFPSERP
jgi:methyltransferase (TIGR00027 family)